MNVALDRNDEKAADSEILADTALPASETQTPNRGPCHLSITYHRQALVPNAERSPVFLHRMRVQPRSRGNGR